MDEKEFIAEVNEKVKDLRAFSSSFPGFEQRETTRSIYVATRTIELALEAGDIVEFAGVCFEFCAMKGMDFEANGTGD